MVEPTSLTVCVTGAAGQIGYAFVPLLLTGQVFGPNTRINLRLLDIPQCEEVLKGVILEIEDGAYPLLNSVSSGSDPKVLFKDIDVGVFIGGFPRKQGMERKELLTMNGNIFKGQGAALSEVAKKDCHCIVVANPANTNCLLLQSNCPNIPKENFSCLTRLDHNRSLSQLALRAGVHVTEVKNTIIWGNHSSTQYPDVNHGTIGGKPIREVIKDDAYLNKDFIERVQKRGAEIIAARKLSSVFSAANAVKDHLRDWYLGGRPGEWTSMGLISKGDYAVPTDICFSYPVVCKGNWQYEIVQGLKHDEFSLEKIKITTQELEDEKKDAFS
jgi:malate dehydrogenase